MAEMTIQLRIDPATGKKNIVVDLRGDDDSLPHEHEQMHKALVDKLIEGGLLKAGEVGRVVVRRDEEETQATESSKAAEQTQRQSLEEGQ